jgi:hypothetical protein
MREVKPQQLLRNANDIIRDRRYFGAVDTEATSIWRTEEVLLFMVGQGENTANLTTGNTVTNKKCDTSLYQNGLIPNSQSFTVYAIGIDIHLASKEATTPFSDNAVTNINVRPLNCDNPYPLVDAIRSQGVFSLYRNATDFLEQGNVADYPCGLYNSGYGSDGQVTVPAAAGFTPGAAYTVNGFVLAQNGMNFRPLSVYHILDELDQFNGRFEMCRQLTLTGSGIVGYIDFLLVGQAKVAQSRQAIVQNFLG